MILVVDDFRDAADALCRLLTKLGYPCRHVGSGREALAAIRAHPPEQPLLVVMDLMMPDMDGVEVLREIRSDPKISTRPVMFHTAGFDISKRDTAMTMGAVAWVLKGGEAGTSIEQSLRTISEWYERVGGVKTAR